jgi:hypothetical protein
MEMENYKLFAVGSLGECEYIVADTSEKAVDDHLKRIGNWQDWYRSKDEVEVREVSLDQKGIFETESGDYKEMTFEEFLGDDFIYEGEAQLICWTE